MFGVCQGLNSHYFHIIGDGHQPNSRGLIPIIRIPIKGGMTIPNKTRLLTMAHVTGATLWSFAKASWGWKSHCSIPIWMETPRRYLYRDLGWKNSGLNQQNYPVILGELRSQG